MAFQMNFVAAWISFLLGVISGMTIGLGFHREGHLGGYPSWRRRLLRLGHISFFGLGALNLAFVLTADRIGSEATTIATLGGLRTASWLLLAGGISMPLVCALAAFRKPFRHLFAVPVSTVGVAVALTLREVWIA